MIDSSEAKCNSIIRYCLPIDLVRKAYTLKMYRYIKLAALRCLKILGGFHIARRLTSDRLRILCYHGFSRADQHEFEPFLFMRRQTFERRMRLLKGGNWNVVALDTAIKQLKSGISDAPVVITIDDGWHTTLTDACPILTESSYPATIYVTSYYAVKATEVFNVALSYVLWKAKSGIYKLSTGAEELDGEYSLPSDNALLQSRVNNHASTNLDANSRQNLILFLAEFFGIPKEDVLGEGRFRNMTFQEIKECFDQGFDIQLHTHRHRMPENFSDFEEEVRKNRKLIEACTGKEARHFCFPSGVYNHNHIKWLEKMGIDSATTCGLGLNERHSNPFTLKRLLDSENISDIEFEAMICGVNFLAQQVKSTFAKKWTW